MRRTTLSVAMCTYNGSRYVLEQLESLATQTLPPDELVVCDDHSADHTPEIVKAFESHAPFPIHLHLNDRRLGSTKNFEKAISLCGGDITLLCDQDDVWLARKLERVKQHFSDFPRMGALFTNAELVDEALRPSGQTLWKSVRFSRREQNRLQRGHAFDVLLKYNIVTGATLAFRSHFRPLILPISEMWVHDAWIALLVAAVGEVRILEDPLVLYRQHEQNQIGTVRSRRKKSVASFTDIFSSRVCRFRDLHDRLQSQQATFPSQNHVRFQLLAKIDHLKARGAMPSNRLRRLPLAVRELVSLRYHRYGRGTRSFTSDLFRAVP